MQLSYSPEMHSRLSRLQPATRRQRGTGLGATIMVLGFAGLILLGTLLLLLPVLTASGRSASLGVALFTSTSAVCVTGLSLVDTGTYWSRFGQTVIMSLVFLGGVGLVYPSINDFIDLGEDFMILQVEVRPEWVGKSLVEAGLARPAKTEPANGYQGLEVQILRRGKQLIC